jgi:hypothetical protein
MRKLVSALAITTGLTVLAGPACAQATQDTREYPPGDAEGVTVSQTTVSPGERFTVAGGGAQPGGMVTFTLQRSSSALGASQALAAGPRLAAAIRPQAQRSISLGSTTANARGQYAATLTIPSGTEPGVYTPTVSSGGEVLDLVTIRVAAISAVGDLPFSGGNVLPGLAIGATLIVAGGLLLLSLKRRAIAA